MPLPASRRAFCAHHYRTAPDLIDAGGARHWITRGVNLVIVVTEGPAGTSLSRDSQPDEYMAIVPPGTAVELFAGADNPKTAGDALAILPPGAEIWAKVGDA